MNNSDQKIDALQQRIAELERKNHSYAEALSQAERIRHQWAEAMETLKRTSRELKTANDELSLLHKVAATVSETVWLDELLEHTLELMTGLVDTPVDCGIFLINDDKMELAASRGSTQPFLDAHEGMRVGDCLCGQVAQSGEMIVTENCVNDSRHTIHYPGIRPHGHLILPLKSKGEVVGVFYYYLPQEQPLPQRKLTLWQAVSAQVGIAIGNARQHEKTHDESVHDSLTGHANRRHLEVNLKREWAAARRGTNMLSVIMLDLDHFKNYNDTHGHPEGDKLLIQVADIIRQCIREEDLPVRYGGEEFLILLRNKDRQQAADVAERLRSRIEQQTEITVSVGVAVFSENDDDPWKMIKRADNALYAAKQNGRNQVITQET
ncbi:diguanylate cyclase [Thiohalophilus thiocyanatoxydans]|uniref:diguanylate cyclase n=1 Tax=Thiohalophilus thiocyanatoxydans TaxID=381308 RepID=A0A4R8IZD2_9GAMM|nr:diguanylate cyclase [Thiohalophilus thiocyanatoxydans]TDY02813.1 diguanylate cyclase (GGDEF)-like protein [Thiohalophilus thiocyanatoxydans]